MTTTTCLPCSMAAETEVVEVVETAAGDEIARWSGPIGLEGERTGDGRLIDLNALRWENLPLPLRWVEKDFGAHDGAAVVGLITSISRNEAGQLIGEGTFDLGSDTGREAYRQVK